MVPQRTPSAPPLPLPVAAFAALQMPQAAFETACELDDVELAVSRLRPLASAEDWQDFEGLLGRWHAARKVLAAVPRRIGGAA